MDRTLSNLEKRVVTALEEGLRPVKRPFVEPARRAGVSEEQFLAVLRSLAARGVARRAAAILDAAALGVRGAALVAWRVPGGELDSTGTALAGRPFITHCVSRKTQGNWPYNLYTMVHGESRSLVRERVSAIATEFRMEQYLVLETLDQLRRAPAKYRFEGCQGAAG